MTIESRLEQIERQQAQIIAMLSLILPPSSKVMGLVGSVSLKKQSSRGNVSKKTKGGNTP